MSERGWLHIAIGVSAAMCLAMGFGRFSYTIMVPLLVHSGELTEFEAWYVGVSNLCGFIVGVLITEQVRRRWNVSLILRTMIFISVAALAASAYEAGFWWLAIWRGVLGLTVGIIMVLGLAIATAVTPIAFRSLATSLIFAGVGLGIFLSGFTIPLVASNGNLIPWLGITGLGVGAAGLAIWGWRNLEDVKCFFNSNHTKTEFSRAWIMLLLAHACFAIGLVPHTIYWVDFIAREIGLGLNVAGYHWGIVGVCSLMGPVVAFILARQVGTAWALVLMFGILAVGISAPGFQTNASVLLISSMTFGAQPGVSALIAARARDVGCLNVLPLLMRQLILINGIAAAIAGVCLPVFFEQNATYGSLFWLAGGFMGLGAALSVPWDSFLRSA